MKKEYHIEGMSCNGCRSHVEKILSNVQGVKSVEVLLKENKAIIESEMEMPLEILVEELGRDSQRYSIDNIENATVVKEKTNENRIEKGAKGIFYCPMRCEGKMTYPQMGDCPVCGMDLVPELNFRSTSSVEWVCSKHKNIYGAEGDTCPECHKLLIPLLEQLSPEAKSYQKMVKKFRIALLFTLPIFLIAMSEMLFNNPLYKLMSPKYWNFVQFILSLPVVFYATWMFFERAYRSIVRWNLNMFTLIGIGAGVAWLFSVFGIIFPDLFPDQFRSETGSIHVYFEAATVILTLALLGQLMETRAHNKTNSAVKELLKLAPSTATKLVDGVRVEVGIETILKGDILEVKPGEKIPVDGKITEGFGYIDESMISGEAIPIYKEEGSCIHSGTINSNHSFLMVAEKIGSETLLSQIIRMVNDASMSKAPIQKIADRVSAYFVPLVVVISLLTFCVWAILGPEPRLVYALINSIAVLIIACPCALGLATPMSIMVGIGKGAQNGILIKNAESLEKLSTVDTIVVDKTGTLTEGKPSLEKVISIKEGYDEDFIFPYLVSISQQSKHPLSKAIIQYQKTNTILIPKAQNFTNIVGKGVEAYIDNKYVALGNKKMLEYTQVDISDEISEMVKTEQLKGKTVSFLSIDNEFVGYVVIADKIKNSSPSAIRALEKRGVQIIMLTGDSENTAKSVAKELDIRQYKAGMLPEEKQNEIKKLQSIGKHVAMAGDGINDAPALAQSDVGIAMGTGTDIAMESASITLVSGDLHKIVMAKILSDLTMKNIKQNLFFALLYNIIGIPIAAGLLFPYFGILLSPMIAALAMSFSSVSVISNALRLRRMNL